MDRVYDTSCTLGMACDGHSDPANTPPNRGRQASTAQGDRHARISRIPALPVRESRLDARRLHRLWQNTEAGRQVLRRASFQSRVRLALRRSRDRLLRVLALQLCDIACLLNLDNLRWSRNIQFCDGHAPLRQTLERRVSSKLALEAVEQIGPAVGPQMDRVPAKGGLYALKC